MTAAAKKYALIALAVLVAAVFSSTHWTPAKMHVTMWYS